MEFLTEYNLTGLVIGIATFLIIGLFHPLVVKGEYYLGVRCWWVFLVMGIVAIAASVAVRHILWSTLLAVWGASSLWSIGELFEQRRRVEKRAPALNKAGAEGVVIHLFLVCDHRVPCPCHPVAHGADAAAHKARKTVRGVVDGLAHGSGGQLGAAVYGGDAPACSFDSFHSTSQYGRPARFLNRAAAVFEIICNFCYQ